MDYKQIAQEIKDAYESIFLVYAFNATGKTQLSVAYKDITKKDDDQHTGVYYNAYSEDLFVWDNDEENDNANIKLTIVPSSLNEHHSFLLKTEKDEETDDLIYPIQKKLKFYNPQYTFKINRFHINDTEEVDEEKGIESFSFYSKEDKEQKYPIKISRGEERIFVWCFFLTLIEEIAVDSEYIFIDDPVSSLDDHNIFITAFSMFELIEKFYDKRKIVITTHHIGFATILGNWLSDPNNPFRGRGRNKYALKGLENNKGELSLVSFERHAVWLYHLKMLQVLSKAIQEDKETGNGIEVYHMAILRQILENISSFLGAGRVSYVLEEIGYSKEEANRIALEDNALTHRNVYYPQSDIMVPAHKELLKDIFNKISEKYHFQYKQ